MADRLERRPRTSTPREPGTGHLLRTIQKIWQSSMRGAKPRSRPKPWEKRGPGLIEYEMAGSVRSLSSTWFRGENCNFHPFRASFSEPDALMKYVGMGWLPDQPFLTRADQITTFGSCFASHVTKFLAEHGYNVGAPEAVAPYVIRFGESMVNTAAIAQQFRWAYGETNFDEPLWHDMTGTAIEYTESMRQATRAVFDGSNAFIITLGLSEVWQNKITGEVFWRAIPEHQFDPRVHGFTILDTTENKANLATAYRIIRQHRPRAAVIFTLSPVPLAATFRPISCVTANSVSKAILRVAVDEFMRAHPDDDRLFYFPSHEVVKDVIDAPFDEDLRHVRPDVVAQIMDLFARTYLKDFDSGVI